LIPPADYVEDLTLKGSVALVAIASPLNGASPTISGAHTYAPETPNSTNNRIGFQNITFLSSSITTDSVACVSTQKYISQLRFSGCTFSGAKSDTYSFLRTDDNVSVYLDNCRFEGSGGGSASTGVTHGNGPLYLSNNTTFNVSGRALDVPTSTTTTRTGTLTIGNVGTTLTVGDTTGLAVGMKVTGTGITSLSQINAITGLTTFNLTTPPQTSGTVVLTFGQTPYVEIHDSVLEGKGAEVVRLGNGLLAGNSFNISNTATGGSGINMLTANTVLGIINSSFTISDTAAYTITAAAATCYAALESVSYSNSFLAAYSTLIGANVTVADYSARATSIENGGTGATTRQAAINALAGAATANQVLAGNGTNVILRALAAADIPALDTGKLTTGTLGVARGGTGVATLTGIVKGAGAAAFTAATAGTDYVIPAGTVAKASNIVGGNNTTLLGSMPYQSATDTTTLLAPNATATKKFLRQTGTGTNGAAPAWDTIATADVPTLNQSTTGTAAGLSATLAVGSGGTGLATTPANGALDIGNGTGFTRATLTAGNNVTITNTAGAISIASDQRIISVNDNSAAALRITQIGTGEALRVEDEANPDASPTVITSTGNIGIGTAAPTSLNGNASKILGISGAINNIVNFTTTSTNGAGIFEFTRTGRTPLARFAQLQVQNSTDDGYFSFLPSAAGADAFEQMRIDKNGVGINNSAPTQKLDVTGVVKATSFMNAAVIATIGSTYTVALTSGTNFTLTLTSATPATITLPSVSSGQSFVLFIKQPGTGTVTTATFTATPSIKWIAGIAPIITPTLGKTDVISFVTDGTSWFGSFIQNF